jgi:hypothetical protein
VKVYQVYLVLIDEDTGAPIATEHTRVFTTDLAAGKFLLDGKVADIWKHLMHAVPVAGTA